MYFERDCIKWKMLLWGLPQIRIFFIIWGVLRRPRASFLGISARSCAKQIIVNKWCEALSSISWFRGPEGQKSRFQHFVWTWDFELKIKSYLYSVLAKVFEDNVHWHMKVWLGRFSSKMHFERVWTKSKMLLSGLPKIPIFCNLRCSPESTGTVSGPFGAQLRKAN